MPDPASDGTPLASAATDDAADATPTDAPASTAPARPPTPQFNPATFVYMLLFLLGIVMIFDTATRNAVATDLGVALAPAIGFGGHYLLLTMFVAAAVEMILTALAYNWATDWTKQAKAAAWGNAFRKVQLEALRSGKKDRVDALKEHQQTVTALQGEVSISTLKGMAVTWFLVIAIYTWVGLYLASLCGTYINGVCGNPSAVTVQIGASSIDLMAPLVGPIATWFVLFSLYTVPMSLLFRRLLKHYSLAQHAARTAPVTGPSGPAA